jgi:hypothetical protein
MPHHVRKQIRDAVVARLTGLATTVDQVFAGRTRPLADEHAPTLLVYAREEASRFQAMGGTGRPLERRLRLAVHGKVSLAATDPEDTLDTIALEVERAMMSGDETFGGLVESVVLTATDIAAEGPDDGGNRRRGDIRLTYDIEYATRADQPDMRG